MSETGKTSKSRRQRAKQLRAESKPSFRASIGQRVGWWNAGVVLAFFALAVVLTVTGESALRYTEGQRIDHAINARVDFQVADPEATREAIIQAREQTPSYFRVNKAVIDRIISELNNMFIAAQADTPEQFNTILTNSGATADEQLYAYLHNADELAKDLFSKTLSSLRRNLAMEHIVRPNAAAERDPPSTLDYVMVQIDPDEHNDATEGSGVHRVKSMELVTVGSSLVTDRAERLGRRFVAPLRSVVTAILVNALNKEPLLSFDQEATHSAMNEAELSIEKRIKSFAKGKPIVFPIVSEDGAVAGLTAAQIAMLRQEETAFKDFLASDSPEAIKLRRARRLNKLATAVVLFILTCGLAFYAGIYHSRILEVRARSVSFATLVLAVLVAARLIDLHLGTPEYITAPVVLACAILTIAYPRRFATGTTVILVLMVGLVVRADLALVVTLLAAGSLICFMLNNIRTRTTVLYAGFCSAVLVFVADLAFGLMDQRDLAVIIQPALIATASTFVAVLLIQACLPLIERGFNVATALTLLEWRDANRPLLQRLAREAPGTYNHSLVLGTMAESACEEIGANGLLAHVGALYHDIGKIPKAEYFAENQEASINRHDTLAPTMSLLIILGHVKDGVEMAKEFGLPRVLIPFIAEHHGTTVVRYFHHMAAEKHSQAPVGKHDKKVSESGFRYPGPKPRSKETAILMLCDGVEGAVRALSEPTAGRIEGVVSQVLQARLKDGQFDECDITLRELHLVEQSLSKSLCRFYHGRVAYPKDKDASKTSSRSGVAVKSAG